MADFDFITDRLATGAAVSTEDDVRALVQAGISHVIDCRAEFDDAPLLASRPLLTYCWNGTADDGQPKPPSWFAAGLMFALPALCSVPTTATVGPGPHPKVYCHCAAGVNRGPSMAYAILLALMFPVDVAEALIRKARPQVGLAYKADAKRAIYALGY